MFASIQSFFSSHIRAILIVLLVPTAVTAAALEPLWTMPSGSLGAGREVRSVSTISVGTDGSAAFVVTTDDGAFGNNEYRLYWIDAAMNDLADDGVPDNEWETTPMEPLLVRLDQLIYIQGSQLYSLTRDASGGVAKESVGSSFGALSTISYMIEQSRNPGVLYLVEIPESSSSFNLHAYAINPVNNPELLVQTQVGIDNGFLKIVFATQQDAMYQIQASDDLSTWTDFQSVIVGTGLPQTFSEAVTTATKQFYRVRKL